MRDTSPDAVSPFIAVRVTKAGDEVCAADDPDCIGEVWAMISKTEAIRKNRVVRFKDILINFKKSEVIGSKGKGKASKGGAFLKWTEFVSQCEPEKIKYSPHIIFGLVGLVENEMWWIENWSFEDNVITKLID